MRCIDSNILRGACMQKFIIKKLLFLDLINGLVYILLYASVISGGVCSQVSLLCHNGTSRP
jgi:hypothetical protein